MEQNQAQGIRINKYIASCGVCSRRDADLLVEQGLVTVNGKRATSGCRVRSGDQVTVRGKKVSNLNKKVVLAYYKPVGVTCTEKDSHAKRIITDDIKYPIRVTYAGRLDRDSEGLLLLTNDGDLIDAMMRGANGHEKEYVVKSTKEWTEEAVEELRGGVYLEELKMTTRPCRVEQIGPKTLKIILTQGVNRQIRRMCKAVGYDVFSLKRTRVINIELANLHPGEYRELSEGEMTDLYNSCKMAVPFR
jgi:23S rRNA pseudouridine2604 synthase